MMPSFDVNDYLTAERAARRTREIVIAALATGFCFGVLVTIIAYSTGFLP